MELRKKIALIGAGSLVSAGALFAVVTYANAADTSTTPAVTSPAAESGYMDVNDANDPTDTNGPADANEANDSSDANGPADANEANDPADANEGPQVSDK